MIKAGIRSGVAALLATVLAACSSDSGSGPGHLTPDNMISAAGDLQTGVPGTQLPIALKVRAQAGTAAAAGTLVHWSVVSGSAALVADTSTTNASGEATVALQMGVVLGPVVVSASADSLDDVIFREMNGDPCQALPVLALNGAIGADLWPIDCLLTDHTPVDFYQMSFAATTNVTFTLKATDWEPYIFLFDTTGFPAALTIESTVGDSVQVRALLAPGRWIVGANTYDATADGPYALTTSSQALDIPACALTWMTRGVDVQQNTGTAQCSIPSGNTTNDFYLIVGEGGKPITLTATAAGFAAGIVLRDDAFNQVATNTAGAAGGTATITYTPPSSDYFWVVISGSNGASLPYQASFH